MSNLTQILQKIHRVVESNTDYPASGEDDYTLRLGLVNDFIEEWSKEEGVNWRELWSQASVSATGADSYDLTSVVPDIDFPGGYVSVTDGTSATQYWNVIETQVVANVTNSSERWCYFTGDPQNGYTLHFNPNAKPSSGTISFPYYKKATLLVNGSDVPEMSDPSYLVHMVSSQVLAEDNPADSDKHFTLGQSRLRAMKTRNITPPEWQSNRLQDRRGVGFGY